jgi:hypothetical protein
MTSAHFTTTVALLPCLRLESRLPIPTEFRVRGLPPPPPSFPWCSCVLLLV